MNNSTDNIYQQTDTISPQKKSGIFSWSLIRSHKILVISLLSVSTIMALSSLVLLEPCHGGMGCIALIPFYVASIPVLPVQILISTGIELITLPYYTFYGMPSFLKLLPVPILSTTAFFVGYIITNLILRLRKNKIGLENYITDVRSVKKNFIFYNFVFIFCFIGFILIQSPPAPFASDSVIIESCRYYEECYQNYINSKIRSCDGEKKMFVYPLKTTLPKMDQCIFDSFGEQKLFKNINLEQGFGGGFVLATGESGTSLSEPTYEIDIVLKIFRTELNKASATQKQNFCGAFSNDIQTGYVSGDISNKEHCFVSVGALPDSKSNLINLCNHALTRESWTQSELQMKCFSTFANFRTYNPNPSIFDEFFGNGWESISFQPGSAIYDNLTKKDKNNLNVVYRLNIRKRYAGIGEFDDLTISQGSTESLFFDEYKDLKTTTKKIETTGTPEERVGVLREIIKDNEVLVERRVQKDYRGERFYNIFHFIKNGTYIQIDTGYVYYLDNIKKDLMSRKIINDILSQ